MWGLGQSKVKCWAVDSERQCISALISNALTLFCEVVGGPACSSGTSCTILLSVEAYFCPASIWQPATLLLSSSKKTFQSLILHIIAFFQYECPGQKWGPGAWIRVDSPVNVCMNIVSCSKILYCRCGAETLYSVSKNATFQGMEKTIFLNN